MNAIRQIISYLYSRFVPPPRRYILVGILPMQWQWLDKPPYEHIRRMVFNPEDKWHEIEGKARLYGTIVDTQTGVVTELRHADNGYFAWSFREYRGEDSHPHPTAGAYWVEAHKCFELGGECN